MLWEHELRHTDCFEGLHGSNSINHPYFRGCMNEIYLADQDRILKLATGQIRGVDTPKKIRARSPMDWAEKPYAFASRDEAYAWEIAANAQRAAAYAGYDPKSLGIEAYVLRSSGNPAQPDRFDTSFFRGKSPDSIERLTVLKANRTVGGEQIDYGLMAKLQPADYTSALPAGFETNGRALLNDLLKAYRMADRKPHDDDPVFDVLRQTGHPFLYSNGFHDVHGPNGSAPGSYGPTPGPGPGDSYGPTGHNGGMHRG